MTNDQSVAFLRGTGAPLPRKQLDFILTLLLLHSCLRSFPHRAGVHGMQRFQSSFFLTKGEKFFLKHSAPTGKSCYCDSYAAGILSNTCSIFVSILKPVEITSFVHVQLAYCMLLHPPQPHSLQRSEPVIRFLHLCGELCGKELCLKMESPYYEICRLSAQCPYLELEYLRTCNSHFQCYRYFRSVNVSIFWEQAGHFFLQLQECQVQLHLLLQSFSICAWPHLRQ